MQYTTVLLLALGVASASAGVHWTAKNKDDKTCVIFDADTITAKLNVVRDDNVTEAISFTIANETTVNGNCIGNYKGEPANILEVSFFPNGEWPTHATDGQPWKLTLWFTADKDAAFKLADYQLDTAPGPFINATTPQTFNKSETAEVDVRATGTNGFKCSTSGLALSLDSTIELKGTRVIANALLDNSTFPDNLTYEQCALDARTSDIVPIVVGACLAGLVAVVLVAYLVGRARAKRQGYASV